MIPGQRFLRACVALFAFPAIACAQTFSPNFAGQLVASGLTAPTAMEFAPDGRLFVCEKAGTLRVIKAGTLLPDPFLTVPVDSTFERGLLGVAFDPNFAVNHQIYVHYVTNDGVHSFNRISRFTASGDTVVPGSEVVLMNLDPMVGDFHSGGAIHFGPDGKLYIGVGDNSNPANSQSLETRFGKLLRLNPDGSIPTDNPFFDTATGDNRAIWAMGLRNPFTFAFHPTTGALYLNDVGFTDWEEIDVGAAGANYGWGTGSGANEGPFDPAAFPGLTPPLVAYGHGEGTDVGGAIAGGAFYRPAVAAYPASYLDDYFYADFSNGWIRAVNSGTANTYLFASDLTNITDLKVGADGNLYYLHYDGVAGEASVNRIVFSSAAAPEPSAVALMAAGFALLGARIRRRRRN